MRRQTGDVELEQTLRLVDAGQVVLPEIRELLRGIERIARPLGEQDLPTAARLADPRGAVHVEPEVGVAPDCWLAGVQAHADTELHARRPVVLGKGLLRGRDRSRGAAGVDEDDEELVAPRVDDDAALTLDRLVKEPAVVVEHVCVVIAQTLHELRRAFDVGEDESDRSMRKIRHPSLLQRDLGTNTGPGAGRAVDVELPAQRGDTVGETAQS